MPLTQVSSRAIEDTLRYVLGASGTNHYTFTGKGLTGAVNDPTLTLSRGHTYIFENRSGGHPFYIKTSIANGGTNDAYNTGVTNNGGAGGTEIVFTVPHDAPDLLYYQCSSHINMAGQLKIAGAVADGSITEAKLADDAVTADKLANSINTAIAANTAKTSNATHTGDVTGSTSLTIANDAVTNAKIADNAVGVNQIADNAVDMNKLANLDNGRIIARVSSGAGNPEAATDAQVRSLLNISGGLQVLEQFYSLADGSSFTTNQGTITLADVTSVLNLTTSFQTLDGSEITYTPPSGTVQVIYEVQFGLRSADSNAILGGHLRIDSDTILDSRFGLRGGQNYSDMLYTFKYGINIGGSSSSTTGRVASWTSGKTLKLELNEHNSSFEWIANILGNYGYDGHQGVCMRPRVGITAIGAY